MWESIYIYMYPIEAAEADLAQLPNAPLVSVGNSLENSGAVGNSDVW